MTAGPSLQASSQRNSLYFAARLLVDVYVGSPLVIGNLCDVYVSLPNGALKFTLSHQTFSLRDRHAAGQKF